MAQSISFKPTPNDALDADAAVRPGRWGRYERIRYVLAGMILALLLFFVMAAYDWRAWGLFILRPGEIAAFAFAGAVMGWLYGRARPPPAADDHRLAERTVTIGADGLTVEGRGYETRIDWTAVAQIATRGDVLLFITEWKEVHFVPAGAFPTPAAATGFAQAARDAWSARWDAATAASPATA